MKTSDKLYNINARLSVGIDEGLSSEELCGLSIKEVRKLENE